MWIVGVRYNKDAVDPLGEGAKSDIADLDVPELRSVRTICTYMIEGDVSEDDLRRTSLELLSDRLVQNYSYSDTPEKLVDTSGVWFVEVKNKPGVTDAVGDSTLSGMGVLGVSADSVKTGTIYLIEGELSEEHLETICRKCLANPIIQEYTYKRL
jgi:phosphoribosylformylglycinamidine (FGAM) synthase PurS component